MNFKRLGCTFTFYLCVHKCSKHNLGAGHGAGFYLNAKRHVKICFSSCPSGLTEQHTSQFYKCIILEDSALITVV